MSQRVEVEVPEDQLPSGEVGKPGTGNTAERLKAGTMCHGRVVFIGSGLSSANQLTRSGLRALRSASILVTTPELRHMLEQADVKMPAAAQTHYVADIDDVGKFVIESALSGESVARFVRGDPLLEGNIGDEVKAYIGAGLMLDIVPGVPSLTSITTLAGVSFPSQSVQLISLPYKATKAEIPATGSLAIGCYTRQAVMVAQTALDVGRAADQEVLITFDGGTLQQHSENSTIGALVGKKSPITPGDDRISIVFGPASHRPAGMNWYESKPLFGWEVLVPLTRDHNEHLIERLELHGAHCTAVPTIDVEPPRNAAALDRAIRGLVDGHYQWVIFTSGNAVRAVAEKVAEYGLDARALSGLQIAAVGDGTRESLARWGIIPDLSPTEVHTVSGLAAEFPAFDDVVDPMNSVLIPKAEIATEPLTEGLAGLGWEVDDVIAYRTVRAAPPPAHIRESIKTGDYDAVVFTSSTTVRNLIGIAGKPHAATMVAAIGPATAVTAAEHGLDVSVIADAPGQIELADSLAQAARHDRQAMIDAGKPVKRPSQRRRRRAKSTPAE